MRYSNPVFLGQAIAALGKKARDGSISIDDMAGGTFTISNGGVYGSLLSTPIINPPQVATLKRKPSRKLHHFTQSSICPLESVRWIWIAFVPKSFSSGFITHTFSIYVKIFLASSYNRPERIQCTCILCLECTQLLTFSVQFLVRL